MPPLAIEANQNLRPVNSTMHSQLHICYANLLCMYQEMRLELFHPQDPKNIHNLLNYEFY